VWIYMCKCRSICSVLVPGFCPVSLHRWGHRVGHGVVHSGETQWQVQYDSTFNSTYVSNLSEIVTDDVILASRVCHAGDGWPAKKDYKALEYYLRDYVIKSSLLFQTLAMFVHSSWLQVTQLYEWDTWTQIYSLMSATEVKHLWLQLSSQSLCLPSPSLRLPSLDLHRPSSNLCMFLLVFPVWK